MRLLGWPLRILAIAFGETGVRTDAGEFAVSIREAMTARCSPPPF